LPKIIDTLKIAALNALSAEFLNENNYRTEYNRDPFSLLDLQGNKTVTLVGAFKSYIEKLAGSRHKLNILELNEESIPEHHRKHYIPAEKANEVIPQSDVVLMTGLTLVNKSSADLLDLIPENCQLAVVGPSSSFIPDVLFENKVNIVGAIKITNPEKIFKLVGEAAAGFHLFKSCAEKICIIND